MLFKKEFLQEVIYSSDVIYNKIAGKRRWADVYECVFKHEDKFYMTHYQRGATEVQDSLPYEYDDAEIECREVFAKEKVIIVYE